MADREIVVVGEGTAWGVPDRCDVWLSIDITAAAVGDAVEGVTSAATATTEALKAMGIPEADIQTQGLMVTERFDHQKQEAMGYAAQYGLAVVRRPVGEAGSVISTAAEAAGEALRVHRLQVGFMDRVPLEQHARAEAVGDAQRKASQLADAAGVAIGPITRIEHGTPHGSFGVRLAAAGTPFMPSAPPIEAGSSAVTATVAIVFAIASAS